MKSSAMEQTREFYANSSRLIPQRNRRHGLYTFSLVCILAFRTAKMPMIIWRPVLANEPPSAAFTSANSWHLKKPPKIKQSKPIFFEAEPGEGTPFSQTLTPL
jgi:hypothetical protein